MKGLCVAPVEIIITAGKNCSFLRLCIRCKTRSRLTKQRQDALVGLICLCKHGLPGLCKDLIVGVSYHFGGHIRIADLGFCGGGILHNVIQIVDGVL